MKHENKAGTAHIVPFGDRRGAARVGKASESADGEQAGQFSRVHHTEARVGVEAVGDCEVAVLQRSVRLPLDGPFSQGGSYGVVRCTRSRAEAVPRSVARRDHRHMREPTAEGLCPLVGPHNGEGGWRVSKQCQPYLALERSQAASHGAIQALQGSGFRAEVLGRDRAVLESAGPRARPVLRRKEPEKGLYRE